MGEKGGGWYDEVTELKWVITKVCGYRWYQKCVINGGTTNVWLTVVPQMCDQRWYHKNVAIHLTKE